MNKYTATFADGTTITRNSTHAYAVAWRATWTNDKGHRFSRTGFSATASKPNAEKPTPFWYGDSSKARAKARNDNAKWLADSDYKVEVVAVVRVGE